MNKKLTIYSLVALLTASTITVSITDTTKAQQNQPQSTRSDVNTNTEVDKLFIEMMIPHHQGAVEMAQMAVKKAKNPEIKKLAESIIKEQKKEIGQMRSWYKKWYNAQVPKMENMQMHHNMGEEMMMVMHHQEMMDQEMMVALKNASNFDREFLRQMISHHEMALMMAGIVVEGGVHPETRKLASSIIKSQSAEINKMGQLAQTIK